MYEVIIIGAGPIGLFASFYSALRGLKTLTLESSNSVGGQLTKIYPEKPIYDLPGIKEIINIFHIVKKIRLCLMW